MPGSGIPLADDIKTMHDEMKLKRTSKAILFGFNHDDTCIEMIKTVSPDKNQSDEDQWNALVADLRKLTEESKRGCYALHDFGYTNKDGTGTSKVIFICWVPDSDIGVKQKMLLASTKDSVVKTFEGVSLSVNANDMSDLDREEIIKNLGKLSRA